MSVLHRIPTYPGACVLQDDHGRLALLTGVGSMFRPVCHTCRDRETCEHLLAVIDEAPSPASLPVAVAAATGTLPYCTCGHRQGTHSNRRNACGSCPCTRFEAAS